ncbi:MAG: hypothetical protein P8M73_01740 [Luminiphilus sp.]|jgi:DNA polymerase III subunit delta'|nr:hypothetical protein [Luminiphilus sp.]
MTAEDKAPVERALPPTPPWLKSVIDRCWSASAAQQNVGHAYIVSSSDRFEASLLSQLIAALKLCSGPKANSSCGHCLSCRGFAQGAHGDLLEVHREPGKVAIGIDQIRAAVKFLQQTPLYGDIKILLIEDADKMTAAAANSLLKTLEEPAGNSLILLSTAESWRLSATIRSRCQLQRILAVPREESVAWLVAAHDWDERVAASALALNNGCAVESWMKREELDVALFTELVASFDNLLLTPQPPSQMPALWSRVEPEFLLFQLMAWCEQHCSESELASLRASGCDWLLLHRSIAELWNRLRNGAVPSKDVLLAEVFRLCRSITHREFAAIAERFLSNLGRVGSAG